MEAKTPDSHWSGACTALPSHCCQANYYPRWCEAGRRSVGWELGVQVVRFQVVQDGYPRVCQWFIFEITKENWENQDIMILSTLRYLDPKYRITCGLTDVYYFGVVPFELLCARKAIGIRSLKHQWPLASWDKKCKREETMNKIIDLYLMGKIASVFQHIRGHCNFFCAKWVKGLSRWMKWM